MAVVGIGELCRRSRKAREAGEIIKNFLKNPWKITNFKQIFILLTNFLCNIWQKYMNITKFLSLYVFQKAEPYAENSFSFILKISSFSTNFSLNCMVWPRSLWQNSRDNPWKVKYFKANLCTCISQHCIYFSTFFFCHLIPQFWIYIVCVYFNHKISVHFIEKAQA